MRRNEGRNTKVRRLTREYFERCEQLGRRYTLAGLKAALGLYAKDWDALRSDPRLGPELELALMRIMDELEQRGDSMALLLRRELGRELKEGRPAAAQAGKEVLFGGENGGREYGR